VDDALDLADGLLGVDDLEDAGDRVTADVAALGPSICGVMVVGA
jgi:hypothetical protein